MAFKGQRCIAAQGSTRQHKAAQGSMPHTHAVQATQQATSPALPALPPPLPPLSTSSPTPAPASVPAPATTRAKVVARFARVLGDPVLGKRLEICLWNWMIRTCERDGIRGELLKWANPKCRYRYTTRALSLEFNLKNPGNPSLLERIKSKTLSVKAFADMTPHQMWPEHWEPVYQRVALQQMRREAGIDSTKAPDGACKFGRPMSQPPFSCGAYNAAEHGRTNYLITNCTMLSESLVKLLVGQQV